MNLDRFIKVHEEDYDRALQEIKNGKKTTHWMWYIFPQITGLGMSETAKYYEIKSLFEASAYLKDEFLRTHLIEISRVLLELETNDPVEVFGEIDAMKLKSSMTLFSYVSYDDVFGKVLDKYFNGERDQNTLKICENLEK